MGTQALSIVSSRRFWFVVGAVVVGWNLWKLGLWVQGQIPQF